MSAGDFRFFLILFAFAITFCGEPDLHDALISTINNDAEVSGE